MVKKRGRKPKPRVVSPFIVDNFTMEMPQHPLAWAIAVLSRIGVNSNQEPSSPESLKEIEYFSRMLLSYAGMESSCKVVAMDNLPFPDFPPKKGKKPPSYESPARLEIARAIQNSWHIALLRVIESHHPEWLPVPCSFLANDWVLKFLAPTVELAIAELNLWLEIAGSKRCHLYWVMTQREWFLETTISALREEGNEAVYSRWAKLKNGIEKEENPYTESKELEFWRYHLVKEAIEAKKSVHRTTRFHKRYISYTAAHLANYRHWRYGEIQNLRTRGDGALTGRLIDGTTAKIEMNSTKKFHSGRGRQGAKP